MDRRTFLQCIGFAVGAAGLQGCFSRSFSGAGKKLPNILFILADDLGARDLACYGSEFYETPNLDRLAAEGIKFTSAYAASPVCAPTRAAIFAGKHPARMGIDFILNDGLVSRKYKLKPPHCETEMKLSEYTFAEHLQNAGYKTFFAGKWHLGKEEKFYPQHQGFDVNIAGHAAGQPASYFYPYKSDDNDGYFNVPNLEDGSDGEYLTDRLTNEMISLIKKNKRSSFLSFLSYYSPHTPLEGKPELVEKYINKAKKMGIDRLERFDIECNACFDYRAEIQGDHAKTNLVQKNAVYAAMIESIDQNVGRLLQFLDKEGLADDTVIIFYSDNGGFSTFTGMPDWLKDNIPTSNKPLRAGKGWLYEGGVRVPLIMRWNNVIIPSRQCDYPVTSVDFYPTILEVAGIEQDAQHLDGISLLPLLKGRDKLDRETLYWHIPNYHSSGLCPSGAVRWKDYKLIEYYENGRIELFDLSVDESEQNEISSQKPAIASKLKKMLSDWRDDVGAAMPTPWQDVAHSDN
jgi:arylsulfatase A